jgi:hypothetical protein
MESLLEVIINKIIISLPWMLLLVFGSFSIFVKEVRVTSSVVFLSAVVALAMQGVYEEGTTISYLYKGVIDVVTGLALIVLYGQMETKKALWQAPIFILFMFSHYWLIYEFEVFEVKDYWFYDRYDSAMVGLTIAHFLVMWDYYEELYKKIQDVWATRGLRYKRALRFINMVRNRKPRKDDLDSSFRGRPMGLFRSGTYDKERNNDKEGSSYRKS